MEDFNIPPLTDEMMSFEEQLQLALRHSLESANTADINEYIEAAKESEKMAEEKEDEELLNAIDLSMKDIRGKIPEKLEQEENNINLLFTEIHERKIEEPEYLQSDSNDPIKLRIRLKNGKVHDCIISHSAFLKELINLILKLEKSNRNNVVLIVSNIKIIMDTNNKFTPLKYLNINNRDLINVD